MKFKCLFIESYEVSNDTVMIRLQKDTYDRDFNLESGGAYIRYVWSRYLACTDIITLITIDTSVG